MEAYIASLKRSRLEWLAEDSASSISDKAYAAKLLSGSGLSARDQKQIYYLSLEFQAGSAKVEELLRVMYPSVADLERRAGRALPAAPAYRRQAPQTYTKSSGMGSTSASPKPPWKGPVNYKPTPRTWKPNKSVSSAHVAEDAEEQDNEPEEGSIGEDVEAEQFDEDEQTPEEHQECEDEGVGTEEEEDSFASASAAFAAGWSAKAKTADQRKARGFSKTTTTTTQKNSGPPKKPGANSADAIARRKARSLCAACGQQGHWKGDACCPKSGQSGSSSRVHFVGMA
eukprot:6473640-Amphidinium_carterae.1